jgi:hypothetical protein
MLGFHYTCMHPKNLMHLFKFIVVGPQDQFHYTTIELTLRVRLAISL